MIGYNHMYHFIQYSPFAWLVVLSLSKMSAKTKRRKKNLADSERTGIMCTLLQCAGGSAKVSRADIESVALAYACSPKTIMRVWKRGRDTMARSPDLLDVRSKIKGKKGKERIDAGAVQKKMEAAPYRKRYTLRSLARVTGASASTLCRMRKRNDIVATTNAIKPLLTDENKRAHGFRRPVHQRGDATLLPNVRRHPSG